MPVLLMVVLLVVVLSPASPSPGGGAVGGGAAACSPTVSQEEEEVVCTSGAVPATASGPFAHLTRAQETLGSSRDNTLGWRWTSWTESSAAGGASRQGSGPHDLGCMRAWRFEPKVSSEAT